MIHAGRTLFLTSFATLILVADNSRTRSKRRAGRTAEWIRSRSPRWAGIRSYTHAASS